MALPRLSLSQARALQSRLGQAAATRGQGVRPPVDRVREGWTPPEGLAWCVSVGVPFTYGASKNAIWGRTKAGGVYLTKEAKTVRDDLAFLITSSLLGKKPYHNRVWLDVMVEKPNHAGDAVNVLDLVADAVKIAIPVDDRWYSVACLDWRINKTSPWLYVAVYQKSQDAFEAAVCGSCGAVKALSEFPRSKGKTGRGWRCINCPVRRTR